MPILIKGLFLYRGKHQTYRKRLLRCSSPPYIGLISFLSVLIFWELLYQFRVINPIFLSSPLQMVQVGYQLAVSGVLLENLAFTLKNFLRIHSSCFRRDGHRTNYWMVQISELLSFKLSLRSLFQVLYPKLYLDYC